MGLIYEQEMAIREMEEKNPTIEQIEAELKELEERKKKLQELYASKCDLAIREAIEKSAQEKNIKRVSPNIIIIKASDLIGKPWNYEFHDWYKSKEVLLHFLSTKPAEKWHDCVTELVESAKDNVVYIKTSKKSYSSYFGTSVSITDKTPISLDFLKAVLKNIEK